MRNSAQIIEAGPARQPEGEPERPKLAALIGHFAGHVLLGTGGFIILAAPAIVLSLAAYYLRQTPVSEFVVWLLENLHYLLLAVDTIVFVAYIIISLYAAWVELVFYVRDLRAHARR